MQDGTARCDIWDTAGQGAKLRWRCCNVRTISHYIVVFVPWGCGVAERYRSLAPMYYRGAQAAIVVFSLGDEESFEGARSWVTELNRKAEPGVVIAIAGNKKDLPKHSVDSNVRYAWFSVDE